MIRCLRHSRMISSTNKAGDRQVDGTDRHQPSGSHALKRGESIGFFGGIGAQDEVGEFLFSFFQLLLLFGFAQVWIDADIVLALVFAEVEDFKGTVVFSIGF